MRISTGAIIHHESKLLIVKPTYRDYWLVPGGLVEIGESPRDACRREVLEEIGLDLPMGRLLCVDFWREGTEMNSIAYRFIQLQDELIFLFDGGSLTASQVAAIRLPERELSDFTITTMDEAVVLLAPFFKDRLRHVIQAQASGVSVYLEAGRWPIA